MKLNEGDTVIAVAPERHGGPGWANRVICVVVLDREGDLRRVWIRADEMTAEMVLLFETGAVVHAALVAAVMASQTKPRRAARSKRR